MSLLDLVTTLKIANQKSREKKKEKAIHNTSDIMGIYAENAVRKFKNEYIIQSERGKRFCSVPIDPYPDQAVIKKIWGFTKKEYLVEFEKVLAKKLEEHGFKNFILLDNPLNAKCSVTLKVKW